MQTSKYNQWLPDLIKSSIDEESTQWKTTMMNLFQKALTEADWSSLLAAHRIFTRFDQKAKYKLSIEDKEKLCPILYKIAFHEQIALNYQERVCNTLASLLVKKEQLNITFDWKPIYSVINKYYFKQFRSLLFSPPQSYGSTLIRLTMQARRYFPSSATKEILDTIRPHLCPHDHKLNEAQGFLSLLLPTHENASYDWLEEFLAMWDWSENNPLWDKNYISLLVRLAEDGATRVKWSPYLKLIFTRILRALDLPVGGPVSNYDRFPMQNCEIFCEFSTCKQSLVEESARFIVWLINPLDHEAFDYLKNLIKSIESFYHPSNGGAWSVNLAKFLYAMCYYYAKRCKYEKETYCKTPSSYRVTDKQHEEFANLMLPLAFTSLYAKSPNVVYHATASIKHLSYITPQLVFTPLFERVSHALTTLTETHQTVAVIESLSVVMVPLLMQNPNLVKQHMSEILQLVLPGIDPNDALKTMVTFKFIIAFIWCIPLVQGSEDQSYGEDDYATSSIDFGSFVEEWCVAVLDRILESLHVATAPTKSGKTKSKSNDELPLLSTVMHHFFQQVSPSIHAVLHKKVVDLVDQSFLPNAVNSISDIVASACLNGNQSASLLKPVVQTIYNKLVDATNKKLHHLTDNEFQYYLAILARAIHHNPGAADPSISQQIVAIAELCWKSESKTVVKYTGKVLKEFIYSLTMIYATEFHSQPPSVWESKDFQQHPSKYWGRLCSIAQVHPTWFIPTSENIELATNLYNQFIEDPIVSVRQYIQQPNSKSIVNDLVKLRLLLKGVSVSLPEIREGIIEELSKKEPEGAVKTHIFKFDENKIKYSRKQISDLLHQLVTVSLAQPQHDVPILVQCIKNIDTIITHRTTTFTKWSKRNKSLSHARSIFFKSNNPKHILPRSHMLQNIQHLLNARYFLMTFPCTESHVQLTEDIKKLTVTSYAKVRSKAQSALSSILRIFDSKFAKRMIPFYIDILKKQTPTDDELNGAIYALDRKESRKYILSDWNLLADFLVSICKCYNVDKPSIQQRLNQLFVTFTVRYKELAIQVGNKSYLETYHKLVQDLLDILKNPTLHWKYQQMVFTSVNLLVRSDRSVMFPIYATKYFLQAIVSDIVSLRDTGVKAMNLIFAQYKPLQPTKVVTFENLQRITPDEKCNAPAPKSEEEWKKTQFYDKNYFGWNRLPTSTKVYDYTKPIDSENPNAHLRQDFINQIKPIILDKEWLTKFFTLMSLEQRTAVYSFSNTMSQMFKGFFQVFGVEFFNVCKPFIENLLSHSGSGKPEEKSHTILAAEWIAGFVRGSKHWTYNTTLECRNYLAPLLKNGLKQASQNAVIDWQSCLRFCAYDLDVRRMGWLLDLLEENLDLEYGTSAIKAKGLHFLYPVLSEISWRDKARVSKVIKYLTNFLSYPYQQVRDMIATTLTLGFKYFWSPPRDKQTQLPILSSSFESDAQNMDFILRLKDTLTKAQAAAPSKDEQTESEFKVTSKTIIHWLSYIVRSSNTVVLYPYLSVLLPLLVTINEMPEPDMEESARKSVVHLASSLFPAAIADQVMTILPLFVGNQQQTESESKWRAKVGILSFVQIFGYRHQFYVLQQGKQDILFQTLVLLLKDKSMEVRETTCNTLSGFVKIANDEKLKQLTQEFSQTAKKTVAQDFTQEQNKQKQIEQREQAHFATLALSSLIRAYPYDIPDFLPPILMLLTKLYYKKNIGQNVTNTAKKTLSDFMKYHKDSWHLHKSKFSDDQLQVLNELTSQTYYA